MVNDENDAFEANRLVPNLHAGGRIMAPPIAARAWSIPRARQILS